MLKKHQLMNKISEKKMLWSSDLDLTFALVFLFGSQIKSKEMKNLHNLKK